MADNFTVKISPLPNYCRHASSDHILCGIDFNICRGGVDHHFTSSISNVCIRELLSEIEKFLSGQLSPGTEMYYYIPWEEADNCVFSYSFKINTPLTWSFRHKRSLNRDDSSFDFVCELDKEDIISMRDQLKEQYAEIEWESLGKTPLYTFDLPEKDFEWCYSAKELCAALNDLCAGKNIEALYVSAANYADPLHVRENYVNYYVGSELILQTKDALLDLLIHAEGLFEWRVFDRTERTVVGPSLKLIEDGDGEFCNIGDVYGMFKIDYTDVDVKQVLVEQTDDWMWSINGFDESKLGKPVELPARVLFLLANGYTMSLYGLHEDFTIELFST